MARALDPSDWQTQAVVFGVGAAAVALAVFLRYAVHQRTTAGGPAYEARFRKKLGCRRAAR